MEQLGTLFEELVAVMSKLRGDGGCLWDKEQTQQSLKPYLIEETYEVLAAIDQQQPERIKEELGDLFFQIIFHAQIAQEQADFDMADILRVTIDKMKRRHPHVFGELKVKDTKEILANWEQIKKEEKKGGTTSSVLEGVPEQLPALMRAHRVQVKASRVGFDHQSLSDTFQKVTEELQEFETALKQQDSNRMEDEFGDLLFSLVNVARFIEVNPEEALRKTILRFIGRFRYIEEQIAQSGRQLQEVSLDELDHYWEKAKGAAGLY